MTIARRFLTFFVLGLWVTAGGAGGAGAVAQTAPVEDQVDGRFTVGENGDARYALQLALPPGTGQAAPALSLTYSSQRQDDRLGVGWRLQGGSAITRCSAIPAIDGFRGAVDYGPDDRYCLDGQRLINVKGSYGSAGSVYRTELETWRLVLASNDLCGAGPCSFTVTDRGGNRSDYGTTASSRVLAVGRPDVRVWALARYVDLDGNAVDLEYTETPVAEAAPADGQFYVASVAYSANDEAGTEANRFVRFVYGPRDDFLSGYVGGSRVFTRALLTSVQSFVGTTPVKDYRLAYTANPSTGRPLLAEIRECAGPDPAAPCLPPYSIHWQGPDKVTFAGGTVEQALPQPLREVLPLDLDGNGKGDLAYVVGGTSVLSVVPLISTGTAFDRCPNVLQVPVASLPELLAAELDRDGRGDLIYTYEQGAELAFTAYRSNPTACGFVRGPAGGLGVPAKDTLRWPMDANGDGVTDLVIAVTGPSTTAVVTYLGSAEGFRKSGDTAIRRAPNERFWPAEVNGDGMVDLIQAWYASGGSIHLTTYLSNGKSFDAGVDTELATGSVDLAGLWPLDVNGDGKTDLVQGWAKRGTLQLSTFMANGAGGFVCEHAVAGGFAPGCTTDTGKGLTDVKAFWPMEADGDGRIDLVQAWQDGTALSLVVYHNVDTGFDKGVAADATLTSADVGRVWPLDLNGDGKADLVQGSAGAGPVTLTGYLSQGAVPDLMDTITDPVGGRTAITYRPMSDAAVYAQGKDAPVDRCGGEQRAPGAAALSYAYRQAPAQEPYQTVGGGAMQLVQRVVRANDPGRNRSTYSYADRYFYEDGRTDFASGRGWAGFARLSKLDEQTGRRMVTRLNQVFPLSGTTAEIEYQCDGTVRTPFSDPLCPRDESDTLLTASLTCYEAVVTATGATDPQPNVYEVLRRKTLLDTYSYGDWDFSRLKELSYDGYGNLTLDADLGYADRDGKNRSPDDDVYTCSRFDNEQTADGWQLGYLTDRKVASIPECEDFGTFDDATDFSLERFTYTAEKNLETQSAYDNTHDVFLLTRYGYDTFGNRTSGTPPGPGDRTTRYQYETTFNTFLERLESPPDERGTRLVQSFGYDPRFGVQVAASTPSGNISVQCLDELGRVVAGQGPVPADPAGVIADPNCVSSLVTGDADAFRNARVVTLSTTSRVATPERRVYTETSQLQDWTLQDETPVLRWSRSYVDGLGRDYLSMAQEEPSQGVAASCNNFNSDDKTLRSSVPRYFQSEAVDCTSSGGAADLLWATQSYDAYGRSTRQVTPAGPEGTGTSVTTMAYDKGSRVTVTQAAGDPYELVKVLEYEYYDSDRELRRMIVPADGNATTVFTYDRIGRLTSMTDPATASNPQGVTNTITHDSLGRRTSVDNPDQNTCGQPGQPACKPGQKALTLLYDKETGLLATSTDALGEQTRFEYDLLGRMTRKVLPAGEGSGEVRYGYDDPAAANGLGERTSVEARDPAGTVLYRYSYGYDRYGSQRSTRLELDGAAYDSSQVNDPLARVIRQIYPDGFTVDQSYSMGNLAALSSGATRYAAFLDYAPVGGPRRADYGNGVRADYTYAPTGQPVTQRVLDRDGNPILDGTMSWNHLDQVTGLVDHLKPGGIDYSQSFGYTATRLARAVAPGLYGDLSFAYDGSGNLTGKDGYTYTYQAHRISTGTGSGLPAFAARYDLDGNLIEKKLGGQTWSYVYDVRNRLVRAELQGESRLSVPLYNDAGSRLKKVTPDGVETVYVSPIYQVTRFPDGSREATRYVVSPGGTVATVTVPVGGPVPSDPGAGVPVPGTLYFHRDYLGSTSLTTGEDGRAASRMAYVPYGGVFQPGLTGPDDFRPKFQGKELDESASLYYFGARYYDPGLGRFMTADTQLASDLTQIDTLNRFAFAVNNPVTFSDPTGHSIWDAIGGALIGTAEIVLGVAVDVLSDGALEPLGGALIGAGMNGLTYSATHSGNYSWKQFGIQEGEGAIFGLLTGGMGGEAEAGVSAVTSEAAEETAAATASAEAGELAAESEGEALTSAADGLQEEAAAGSDELGGAAEACASFPAGVTVWTEDGELPIEQLLGGTVLSRNSIDGENAAKPVGITLQRQTTELVELALRSEDGQTERLITTPNHPLWVEGRGWIPAGELAAGDHVSTVDHSNVQVISVTSSVSDQPHRVYNFEVAEYHSYFVGELGVWVHNPQCRVSTIAQGSEEERIYGNLREIAETNKFVRDEIGAPSEGPISVIYDQQSGQYFTDYSARIPDYTPTTRDSGVGRFIMDRTGGETRTGYNLFACAEVHACGVAEAGRASRPDSYMATFWMKREGGVSLMDPCPNCQLWVYDWSGTVFTP